MILAALRPQLPPHLRAIRLLPGTFGPRAGITGASFAGARGRDWRSTNG
jgi:glucokinase